MTAEPAVVLAEQAHVQRHLDHGPALPRQVVTETRAKKENDREDDVSVLAKAAKESAEKQKSPAVGAPFEKTIKYNGQLAAKALASRKKNAEAKQGAGQAPAQGAGQTPPS